MCHFSFPKKKTQSDTYVFLPAIHIPASKNAFRLIMGQLISLCVTGLTFAGWGENGVIKGKGYQIMPRPTAFGSVMKPGYM